MGEICRSRSPARMRVLEIGCGAGRMTRALAGIFGEVHGVDGSGEMIARGRQLLAGVPNVHLHRNSGVDLLVLGDLRFDFAFSFIVFQHIPSQAIIRPALAELIDHARPGDRLCIIRLDRLGRSLRELLETVDGLKARGIHLISLEERLDTSSAAGELVFHVFGSIAHFERRLISERTRDGIAAARKRGRTPGRPPLDPETVSAAQKLIAAGLSPARAAKQLGIGRATAYRIAKALR